MNEKPENTFCNRTHRREFIKDIGGGFAALGLTGMLAQDGFFANKAMASSASSYINPLAPKNSVFPESKISNFLFMYGGPSQVDTFDYKPDLYPLDGKTIKVKLLDAEERETKAGWLVQSGNSSPMENVANMYPTSFPMSVHA